MTIYFICFHVKVFESPRLSTQSQLEESWKKQADIQQTLDVAKEEMENEKENCRKAREEWEREREAMKEEISDYRDNLRHNSDMLKNMEGKHKVQTAQATTFLGVTISFLPPKFWISAAFWLKIHKWKNYV